MSSQFAFRLFDTDLVVEADDPTITALFARAYDRLRVSPPRPSAVRCTVRSTGELVLDGKVQQAKALGPATGSPHALLTDYAYTRVLNEALGRVRTHFLIHAAALSHDGCGLLIAGPSGCGKTTLTLALIQRGFAFLSDDIAALGRADGWLYPCPRALNVRGRDSPTDIESVGGVLGDPCPACVLIELDEGQPQPDGGWLWATLAGSASGPSTSSGQALLAALRELEGIEEVSARQVGRFVEVALRTNVPGQPRRTSEAGVEAALEAVCRERGMLLFDVRRRLPRAPDFNRAPHLTPLAPHQATLTLMRHLRGGPHSALIQDLRGPAGAFLALAEVTAGMRGYRLTVGVKDRALELIQEAMEQP